MAAAVLPIVASALLGGIGSYFGGQQQKQGAETSARESRYSTDTSAALNREQLAENKRQSEERLKWEQTQAADAARERQEAIDREARRKRAASGVLSEGYDTSGYGETFDYNNPFEASASKAIETLLAGGLTEAELAQQNKAIAQSQQQIGANAATMGLPAGARAMLSGQSTSDILNQYTTMGSGRVGQGISAADTAARTGLDIANTKYQTGYQNFLNQQSAKNRLAEIMAQYATPLPTADPNEIAKYNLAKIQMPRISNI